MKRLPRLIRWVLGVCLLLLLLMSAYRLFFFFHYRGENRPFSGSAFWLGVRYDLRIVSVLGLLMVTLTSIGWLNPFLRPAAIRRWTWILSIIFLAFLVLYGADFYHYDYLKQRLNASVLNFLEDMAISAKLPAAKLQFHLLPRNQSLRSCHVPLCHPAPPYWKMGLVFLCMGIHYYIRASVCRCALSA